MEYNCGRIHQWVVYGWVISLTLVKGTTSSIDVFSEHASPDSSSQDSYQPNNKQQKISTQNREEASSYHTLDPVGYHTLPLLLIIVGALPNPYALRQPRRIKAD
eukprot:scaffold24671_cov137-Amphora_coffeaeformis.AAC.1